MCEHPNVVETSNPSPDVWFVDCTCCGQSLRYAPLEYPLDISLALAEKSWPLDTNHGSGP